VATDLYVGGAVYSPAAPDATALAVTDGIVVWVGSDDVGHALHPGARIVDLDGRFVAPAFVDSHVHLTSTGLALGGLTLSSATSRSDCLALLAAAHAVAAPGALLWGTGWDDSAWDTAVAGEGRFPTTAEIDAIVGERPVYLSRIDEHSAVASTALRRRLPGLADATGFHPAEPLVADAHHLLRGAARALLNDDQRRRAQIRALDHAASVGVVAVHENGGPDISGRADFLAIADLDHPISVRRYWGQAAADPDEAHTLMRELRADALGGDLFVDGSLGSHTAWLSQPYADAPERTGITYLDHDIIRRHIVACTTAGIQAGFHVIGDAAAASVAAAFGEVADELGTPALARCAHRLEHAEMISARDTDILARCGVIASMQPQFDAAWGGSGELYEQRLGADRAAGLNDFGALAKAGVALSFSSDAPVTGIDPWATIRAAVHHHQPRNAISARAAFAATTRGGWRAGGINDGLTGTLVPGAPAHFAVWEADELVVVGSHAGVQRWSTDPRARVPALPDVSPAADLPRCVQTFRDGVCVYSAETAG
jgi:predicted amidohydrolase YtcJ